MFNDKDRELISIAASIASGCEPCIRFHLGAARLAGASDGAISQAVHDALAVRRQATEGIAQFAKQHAEGFNSTLSGADNSLIGELASISAAAAVNSVSDLETHLAAARTLGATKGQVLSAIKIAGAVKGTAEGRLHDAAGRVLREKPVEKGSCCPPSEDRFPKQAVQAAAPAEERSGTGPCGPLCGCHNETQKNNH